MIGYFLAVAAGVVAAAGVSRWQGNQTGLSEARRTALFYAAVGGAIFGAYGLQLPADVFGWSGPPPAGAMVVGDAMPMGGRTVVGGLIGGWLAVEFAKWRAGIRASTGDGFALPLAVALAFGRIGCFVAGCCAGKACQPAWWSTPDAGGVARFPTQLIEAAFHLAAAILLAVAVKRNIATGRRFLIYMALYAVVRFALEFARENKPIALGLSWYQWLCVTLLAIAGVIWRRNARAVTSP